MLAYKPFVEISLPWFIVRVNDYNYPSKSWTAVVTALRNQSLQSANEANKQAAIIANIVVAINAIIHYAD